MKVYYDLPDIGIEDSFIEDNLTSYEGEEKNNMRKVFQSISKTQEALKITTFIKIKYQIMWGLRSIENEINEQSGSITITKEWKIETKDFTQELTDKIHALLDKSKFE